MNTEIKQQKNPRFHAAAKLLSEGNTQLLVAFVAGTILGIALCVGLGSKETYTLQIEKSFSVQSAVLRLNKTTGEITDCGQVEYTPGVYKWLCMPLPTR